jgi:hypothetical protein
METAQDLTLRLQDLLRREHGALADFLLAVAEFDRRSSWLDLGYASLFDYLHRELGLSKASTFLRASAARLIQKFPDVIEPLRDGRLCLSTMGELSKALTPENRDEVLPRFFHLSKREAKAVAAAVRPDEAPPRREVVTTIRITEAPRRELSVPAAARPQADEPSFSLGVVRPGCRPDTWVTVRPETWVTVPAHALGPDRPDDRATSIRHRASEAQVDVPERVRSVRYRAEDWLQVAAPV